MNNFDYKNMTPFKWFVLENFPFIENDFEAINNYRLFSKVVEYLNKMKDNVNLTGQQMENLTNAMIELQNYVNNYFDNLDVQEEINNKLDEMAESGTLEEIIADYLNSKAIFGYDTVNDMKQATNLIDGSYARTLGFYSINDGGSSFYKIREITNDDIVDNITIIPLTSNNQLIAELIVNDTMYIEQFGVNGEDITNDSNYTNIAINTKVKTLIFNNNYTLKNIILKSNIKIVGQGTINCNNSFGGDTNNNLAISKNNITFDGLTFNFNVSGKLYFKECNNIYIRNCKINSFSSGWNIKLLYCNNSFIENNIIITNEKPYDDGIHVAGENIYINNNYVQNSANISVTGGDDSIAIGVDENEEDLTKSIKNIIINNNTLKTVSRAINIYTYGHTISDINIDNNICFGRLRISSESTPSEYLIKNVNVYNSKFENKNSQTTYVALLNSCENINIKNCDFNTEYGDIFYNQNYIKNIVIDNCNFTTINYKSATPSDYAVIKSQPDNTSNTQLSLILKNSKANVNTKILINGANELTLSNNELCSSITGGVLFSVYNSMALKNMILSNNNIFNLTANQTQLLTSINTSLASASLIAINNIHNFGENAYYSAGVITKTVANDNHILLTI